MLGRSANADESLDAVKELLDAGTGSLGGARPKASVRDGDRLIVAKFSSPRDDWDVIAWEKTVLDLAEIAGLRVPDRKLTRVDGKSVLLLDRFDRTATGGRVPYLSAMTLLTARDGMSDQFDYTDLAETLAEHGSTTISMDLVELWKRVVFSVAVHNTDDHLRNHGFIRGTNVRTQQLGRRTRIGQSVRRHAAMATDCSRKRCARTGVRSTGGLFRRPPLSSGSILTRTPGRASRVR